MDNGEVLVEFFRVEKELFGNNFLWVFMAYVVSSFVVNFDLVIDIFDGCSILVLIGYFWFWKEYCIESCV